MYKIMVRMIAGYDDYMDLEYDGKLYETKADAEAEMSSFLKSNTDPKVLSAEVVSDD